MIAMPEAEPVESRSSSRSLGSIAPNGPLLRTSGRPEDVFWATIDRVHLLVRQKGCLGGDDGDIHMTRDTPKRPRVAAIGLNKPQLDSIAALCGEVRPADTMREYLDAYNWSETDVTILAGESQIPVLVNGHVLAIGPMRFTWNGYGYPYPDRPILQGTRDNTEREVEATEVGTKIFGRLATELASQLETAGDPPAVYRAMSVPGGGAEPLISTTSGWAVALLGIFVHESESDGGWTAVALALPEAAQLSAWLRVFLTILHRTDQDRVPQQPPRLSNPADWYTPQERALAAQLAGIAEEMERLGADQARIEAELAAAGEEADVGIRRCIWVDGEALVDAVRHILEGLGFIVRDMDAEKLEGEPKREDLRLTLPSRTGWEAIAEVKGYSNGTRTSDTRQIREHRDHYITEQGRPPDLTLWIANPYRSIADPVDRPAPDNHVAESAANIDAVHVSVTDLYRLWTLVQTGRLGREEAQQHMIDACPGLWALPVPEAEDTA